MIWSYSWIRKFTVLRFGKSEIQIKDAFWCLVPEMAVISSGYQVRFAIKACIMIEPSIEASFIDLALRRGALQFGHFTLKSGRPSPYFFNIGRLYRGSDMMLLGQWLAQKIVDSGLEYDLLFGAAYKGIPLMSLTAAALAQKWQRDVPTVYNRKEIKAHGEGGGSVGAPITGRVLIVDDVLTAGTAAEQAIQLIQSNAAVPAGLLIAFDRQEPQSTKLAASQYLQSKYHMSVISLSSIETLESFLSQRPEDAEALKSLRDYRRSLWQIQESFP